MITNKNCIIRLSRYKNALYKFREQGLARVFSPSLAEAIGVLPTQVRKDFSLFGISGNKRGGYQIDALIEQLSKILGKDRLQKVIVVGAGNIGTALMKYNGFEKEGLRIVACFDVDPKKIRRGSRIPILPLEELNSFVRANRIKLGVIAVPDITAQAVLEAMISSGIKGVLNFAPLRLKVREEIVINNVNLEHELENVIYFVNALEKARLEAE